MQVLINDFLFYLRINIQERVFEKIVFFEIIEEVKEDLKEEIELQNVVVEIGQIFIVDFIFFQFRQLLYNLVSNVIKFLRLEILLVVKINSEIIKGLELNNLKVIFEINYCYICILDNGIGFDQ